MIVTKTSPVGIDWYIQQFQTFLYNGLIAKWIGVKYNSYGRVYRNIDHNGKGYIAEVYTGNNEYKEVYFDDSLDAISWFGIGNKIDFKTQAQANVHLVFFTNIATLSGVTHRGDNEVRQDVQNIFTRSGYGFTLESIETGLENVLREYPGSTREDRLKKVDMHPLHCFRFNFSINYNPNKIC